MTYRTEARITKGRMTKGSPVCGETIGYTQTGRVAFVSSWSGVFDGVRKSDWSGDEGVSYAYFSDGEINGTPQAIHGMPVAALHGFEHVDESVPEMCRCGAAFVEGYHLDVVKRAHLEAVGA